ncbi:cation:proton antiporter [Sulfurisphaera ohwakuensis]|uniref:Cation:proton antiporter n=1 Tax=Sulfurisphaera ohwakuensis TaxID=69656 RepID=A0A650CER5_SULOH|nr:cation:proton antiporter [Sulfurisphaera ohwakuensis]MBB5252765.1 Kef-type K+ transport system membrane component KefB [Sulfurisphaera ohwakuensis]QGR16294.1 cation:proton antiporter [Sulfurisphaera ohwakuensis]
MNTNDIVILTLLELSILLTASQTVRLLTQRYYLPSIFAELIVGIILSPYAIGGIINGIFKVNLFDINSYLTLFANFSVILLIFAAGLSHGYKNLKSSGFLGFLAATFGAVIPTILVYFTFSVIYPSQVSALMGAASAATSLAATSSIIEDFKLYRRNFARIVISAAAIDDVVSLIILSVVLEILSIKILSFVTIFYNISLTIISWVIILFLSVIIIPRILKYIRDDLVNDVSLVILFLVVFLMILLGFEPIIAAFIVGIAIAESVKSSRITSFTSSLLAIFGPVFFIYVGMETPISIFINVGDVLLGLLMTFLAIIGKIAGIFPFAFLYTKDLKESFLASVGMLPRGEVGLIIATLGLSSAILDVNQFSQVVIMALLTTLIGGSLFSYLVRKWILERSA